MAEICREMLLGSWTLEAFSLENEQGDRLYPLSEEVHGRLIYTETRMSGMMFNAGLEPFATTMVNTLSSEEKAALAASFIGYSGGWELRGETVVHHIDMSYIPNMANRDEVRHAHLTGDILLLQSEPMLIAGSPFVASVRWQREAS